MTVESTPPVPEPTPVNLRREFYDQLVNQFRLIRPFYTKGEPDLDDPTYQKLLIIDRTIASNEAFEAGYSLWLENQDIEAFLNSFVKKVEDKTDNAKSISPQ